uniref:Macro domain-containing protein n=1 Tax=Panagrellus redivivus TaxID=6233 RepID=A0A7E4VIC6_PANRE
MAAKIFGKVTIIRTDITKLTVDIIVNAANKRLLGGGGVDGAIHDAAGPELLAECKTLGGCQTGEAKLTRAYNITNAKGIIHTVAPQVFGALTEDHCAQLYNCYKNSLRVAVENGFRSVAFPCLGTGVYHFPHKEAATIAIQAVREALDDSVFGPKLDNVIFCLHNPVDVTIYDELVPKSFP